MQHYTYYCSEPGILTSDTHIRVHLEFLCKLDIKPHMRLLEIITLSLYHVIIRPTKIIRRADKNWADF